MTSYRAPPIHDITGAGDEASELRLNSSEAYALVLGYRRLCINSVQILQKAQAIQGGLSQIDIPLCRMISLQVVRLILAVDIKKMKADFIHRYKPGAAIFYVSTMDFGGLERVVTDADRQSWDKLWQMRNEEFEYFLGLHSELETLSNKFFFIWDGNHRHQVWTEFISQCYQDNYNWHYRVRSIVLNTKDDVASILIAMHDINNATKNLHVKTNLVHTPHRMQKVGMLLVTSFRDWLTPDELLAMQKQAKSTGDKKPWYPIPRAKFLDYIYSVSTSIVWIESINPRFEIFTLLTFLPCSTLI